MRLRVCRYIKFIKARVWVWTTRVRISSTETNAFITRVLFWNVNDQAHVRINPHGYVKNYIYREARVKQSVWLLSRERERETKKKGARTRDANFIFHTPAAARRCGRMYGARVVFKNLHNGSLTCLCTQCASELRPGFSRGLSLTFYLREAASANCCTKYKEREGARLED